MGDKLLGGMRNKHRVCAKNAHTALDGKVYLVDFYNLDMIIAVGYRVNSNAEKADVNFSQLLRDALMSVV